VHLELGGKAPVVIFDDADVEAAAEWLAVAGYFNAGQDCTAATRVLAGPRIYDDFVAALAEQAEYSAETLQDQLIAALSRVDPDATKWELPAHKLTSRRSTAVELDPDLLPEDLPEQYRRVKVTTSADRTALAAALKAGATVEGAQLVERRSWKIS
jgi:hypothetical protein